LLKKKKPFYQNKKKEVVQKVKCVEERREAKPTNSDVLKQELCSLVKWFCSSPNQK